MACTPQSPPASSRACRGWFHHNVDVAFDLRVARDAERRTDDVAVTGRAVKCWALPLLRCLPRVKNYQRNLRLDVVILVLLGPFTVLLKRARQLLRASMSQAQLHLTPTGDTVVCMLVRPPCGDCWILVSLCILRCSRLEERHARRRGLITGVERARARATQVE